ncbi:MAG: ATP-binding protein [Oscillospiraceae bacterium]|nr:ATP-binding protein [Oscillospiraceae bacterium]
MKKAIYFRLIALTFVAVLVCSFIAAMIYALGTQNQTKIWLTKLTLSAAENYKHDSDVHMLSRAAGGNRVTIIGQDGEVLADSETNSVEMESHAEREEVQYAKTGGVIIVMRTSSTTGQKFMYAAIKTQDGNVLRLAHGYSGLLYNLAVQLPAILTAIVTALILSLFLAGRFTKTVTRPLEKMVDALSAHEYDKPSEYKSPYYEIDKMMQTLQDLLQRISDSKIKLQDEQKKIDTILGSIAEGFVLVNSRRNILLCNNSAREFLGAGSQTRLNDIYNLTRDKTIGNALQSAIDSTQSSVFDLRSDGDRTINVYISPSKVADNEMGATMLLVDVTTERRLEQQKRDFFSNASHELKTPITSILGFSEMLNKDMVKSQEEKADIMSRIETEAKRMSELIGDILTISKLETNREDREHTEVDFGRVITDAVSSLSPVKDDTAITINTDFDDILYRADRRQLYELCINLIENAVKYNKPNGSVDITLKKQGRSVVLTVKDTGIGIPLEYQPRVFERFYRVDYGRDKKVGGTGLGLSIVKHIAGIYGGKISLQSKKDEGTAVTVWLPV